MGSERINIKKDTKALSFPLDRVPPQNVESEKCVLGSMLIDNDAISRVIELIDESHFYKDAHRKIYTAILNLYDKNEPIDIITVTEELKKGGELEAVGDIAYVDELINTVPTAANIDYYAKIVLEKAILRKLITSATAIITRAYEAGDNTDNILDEAEQLIFNIAQKKILKGFVSIKSHIPSSIEKVESLYQKKSSVTGVSSGFVELDNMTSGFQPSDLIIVAARPSMGKTSFCLNVAQHIAVKEKGAVAIFSIEMSVEQLVLRMLCSEARVDLHRVRSGRLFDQDWPKLTIAAGVLSEAPIYIDDTAPLTVLEMRAKIRRLLSETKADIKLLMVDYIQMMHIKGRVENRQQEIAEISRSLKALAKELKIPIIAISQLSRAPERRGEDSKPKLSDLRESGAIEQDADVVAFIYKEFPDNAEADKSTEVIFTLAKQRNGPTGDIHLAFIKEYTRFENISYRQETP